MALRFTVIPSQSDPVPGQQLALDVYASADLATAPVVRVDTIKFARLLVRLSSRAFRYTYIPSAGDRGDVSISGGTVAPEYGQTLVPAVFSMRYAGTPNLPFGMFPFGFGHFATADLLPPSGVDPLLNVYDFVVRRGAEGPQIVTSWNNPDALNVQVIRREREYATSLSDPEATVVYSGIGSYYSDLDVLDDTIYYYTLFFELTPSSGEFSPFGYGHVLAIDNQPYVDWEEQDPVLSRTTTVEPMVPVSGDRYIVPIGASGANWTGQDGNLAVYDGAAWTFSLIRPQSLFEVADEDYLVVKRNNGSLTSVTEKERVDFYELLEDMDRRKDLESAYAVQLYAQDAALDGEQFNTDLDQAKSRPTMHRFLRNFNLPYNEWKGQADHISRLYELRDTDINNILRVGALVGFDDFPKLGTTLRRFLVENINAIYPQVGSIEATSRAVDMWLGTQVEAEYHNFADNLFVANTSECPRLTDYLLGTPDPDPTWEQRDDAVARTCSMRWASLYHPRGMLIWINRPFDPQTYVFYSTVKSVTTDVAAISSPAVGDRYVVPDPATGVWLTNIGRIAEWDGSTWVYTDAQDRWSVVADDTGETLVWRADFGGAWWEPIAQEALVQVEWWLRNYALPESVYFEFREFTVPAAAGSVVFFDGFDLW